MSFRQSGSENRTDSLFNRSYFEKDLVLITGYQRQGNHFAELGLGIMKNTVTGHHMSTIIYGLSNELKSSDDFVWGLKAGLWLGGGSSGMNLGLNFIHYSDFEESALRFRPEIGFGISMFRIVYGRNLSLANKEFNGVSKNSFGINIMLKLKRTKRENGN